MLGLRAQGGDGWMGLNLCVATVIIIFPERNMFSVLAAVVGPSNQTHPPPAPMAKHIPEPQILRA